MLLIYYIFHSVSLVALLYLKVEMRNIAKLSYLQDNILIISLQIK